MTTILGVLVAIQHDTLGYINYVFRLINKEAQQIHKTEFITCVRYPNWNCRDIKIGDAGYIHINDITAGIDKWYDGKTMIPYKYNHTQFIKFIPTGESEDECIL